MIILPAIDIKDGTCVRLRKGDFDTVEKVAENPLDTALQFEADGAKWIHMVDLDGAVAGEKKNAGIFTQISRETKLKVELGGGIRTMKDMEFYLEQGVSRLILGSAAVKQPELVKEAVKEFGSHIAVGIDAKNGKVAVQGWLQESDLLYTELAKKMEDKGVKYIIFTDISRDGMLTGPNMEQLNELNQAVSCDIIASGGVTNLADIKALKEAGLYGAICGKSIYKGTLRLLDAIKECEEGSL